MTCTPFVHGLPARDNQFYGRERDVRDALRSLAWTWVCAPRRMGKTSLLLRVADKAKEAGQLAFFFDLTCYRGQPLPGEQLLQEFLASDEVVYESQRRNFDPMEFMDGDPAQGFERFVKRLLQETDVEGVVFLWDEAELLRETQTNDPHFLERLTARLKPIRGFQLLIAASQAVSELSSDAADFFYALQWIPLAGLDVDPSRSLLRREQVGGWLSPLPDEVVEAAIDWCGGCPFLLQAIGAELARQTDDQGKRANPGMLDACQQKLTANPLLRNTIRDDFTKLTPAQQRILSEVCKTPAGLPQETLARRLQLSDRQIGDALGFLRSYGYVRSNGKVELRYRYYGKLAPSDVEAYATQEASVERIQRPLFISYAHADRTYFEGFKSALQPMLRGRNIELWDDTMIDAGDKWRLEIQTKLQRAKAAVLLISNHFLNSSFILESEVPVLLTKARREGCRILCLPVGPTNYDQVQWDLPDGSNACLADFQALLPPSEHLSGIGEGAALEQAYTTVARDVFDALTNQ